MSGSDDTSDFISQSPFSHSSPYSSPSQQVPQLADYMTDLTCADGLRRNGPYLHIVDEPMNHFRFRYKSEMIGTHGCLLGASHPNSKSKTHPTVELRNYSGSAIIRCTLVRHNNNKEHPHKLQDDHDRDVSSIVPDQGSYKVAFSGMGIIHTAKKDVPATLFKKYSQEMGTHVVNEERLRVMCENEAREINLNIVRLKFTAHDLSTQTEICKPVFSKPIHNLKSAATNDLKICRMSRIEGRACGGDDVFLFVEKVKKTNIKVRFFELNEMGERVWSNVGEFRQADVHHQYGIVFQTPPYENKEIKSDVNVFIELVRPSDGRTSEPKPFTYKAHPIHKQNKKRKANSYSSIDSSGSLTNMSDLPVTVSRVNHNYNRNQPDVEAMETIPTFTIKIPEPCESTSNDNLIGDAMLHDLGAEPLAYEPQFASALQQPSMADPPVLHFNSSEIARLLEPNENMTADEKKLITQLDFNDYFSFSSNPGSMSYIKCSLVPDSGRANANVKSQTKAETTQKVIKDEITLGNKMHYSAYYSSEDGAEVKKLVKEICEIIRNKTGYKKQVIRTKLERLFEMRLSNGDAFLHMTLCSNQPSLEYIVKLIHDMKMTRLLNIKNNQMQTILHLAIINDCPKLVSFLISMGCDPMIEDNEGNNAVHYAVICRTCLAPLLESIKKHEVACDLNAYNSDKQSALHLAALYDSAESAALLVRAGASLGVRDRAARTPLHLAVHDRCLPVVRALLDAPRPGDVDAVDDIGYTALQIVCDADMSDNSVEIVTLLLEKKADPMKCTGETKPAWKLARNKPAIMNVLRKYVTIPEMSEDDIKSEPEDDYESADEGEMEDCGGLPELSLYVDEIAVILDKTGVWRDLAKRLSRDSLMSWYTCGISPTKTLLNHIKTYDDHYTSRSLALLLEDMGQVEAANIIRRYISK